MNITRRIDLNLGYSCNIRCRFCYYQSSLASREKGAHKDLDTPTAKKWLRFFRGKGIDEIDLTGGEPTVRKDIAELISYARSIGYRKICIITNGLLLSDREFCRRLVDSGLNDILFSLHGPDAGIHDYLTRVPGSFDRLLTAIGNMVSLGLRARSNTVVTGLNYKRLDECARLLEKYGVRVVNLILFNPIVEAQGTQDAVRVSYAEVAPSVRDVVAGFRGVFEKITVRYMPFCLMKGFEGYVTNTPQIQYDPDEWDYYWRTYFRNGVFMWLSALLSGLFLSPAPGRLLRLDPRTAKREAIKWSLTFKNKVKGKQCRQCAYYAICDGLWRDYARTAGCGELTPVPGKAVTDPTYFMKDNKQFFTDANRRNDGP